MADHLYYEPPLTASSQILHPAVSPLSLEAPGSIHELSATAFYRVLRPAQDSSDELSEGEPRFADSQCRYKQLLRSIDEEGNLDDRSIDGWVKPSSHFSDNSLDESNSDCEMDGSDVKNNDGDNNEADSHPRIPRLDFEVASSPSSLFSFSDIDTNSDSESFVVLTPPQSPSTPSLAHGYSFSSSNEDIKSANLLLEPQESFQA